MAEDIVPALIDEINRVFEREMMADKRIRRLGGLIRDGTTDFEIAHKYSQCVGEAMSKALKTVLTAEALPNETLYYNIADRTVTEALKRLHGLSTGAATTIQQSIDALDEINLIPIIPDFPAERAAGLVDKIAASETLEKARAWLGEAVVNNSESYVDDFIRENAAARSNAGLEVTITRITSGGCCKWCDTLGGTYEYGSHPAEIFQRHEYCRCMVVYKNGKTLQSAWSKRTWSSQDELKERRETKAPYVAPETVMKEYQERISRDEDVREIVRATGFSRVVASDLLRRKKMSVDDIIKKYGRR